MVSVGQEFGDDLAGLGVSHAVEHRQWLELASVSPSWRWKASPWTLREVQFGLPPNVEALTSYVTAEGSRGGCPNGTRQPPYCLS